MWKIGQYLVHLAQMCKSECPNMLQESLRETLGIIGVMGDRDNDQRGLVNEEQLMDRST